MTKNSDEILNSFGVIPVIAVSACLMGDKVRFDGVWFCKVSLHR